MGILIALTVPVLIQDGMFTDGILYAAVSHNLARGMGTFWHPYFNETMFPFFHQHPPLALGMESVFFRIFGDSLYVERVYSFLTLLVSAYLITRLWKCVYSNDEKLKSISWLPVILWIIIPVCFWAYSNNMIENTMGIFALLSVLFAYKGLKGNRTILYLGIAGIGASLAFLCKGFPGVFVIGLPFLYWLFFRSFSFGKMLAYSMVIIGTIAFIYFCLLLNVDVRNDIRAYLNDQVVHSILYVSTESNRLSLLFRLFFAELSVPIAVCLILWGIFKGKHLFVSGDKKTQAFFFLVGISASFPLIISMEQREYYLVTSLPYFAIAFAAFVGKAVSESVNRIKLQSKGFMAFRLLSVFFVAGGILYSVTLIGSIGRDKEQLHDIYLFGKIIPPKTTIRVYTETWQDWGLHNYLSRYFDISMTDDTNKKYKYFMLERKLNKTPPSNYSKIGLNTLNYDLYEH